jgi:hypothetical protein
MRETFLMLPMRDFNLWHLLDNITICDRVVGSFGVVLDHNLACRSRIRIVVKEMLDWSASAPVGGEKESEE